MFLISKIVRGRRLLHELEVQEAKEGGEGGFPLPKQRLARNSAHRRSSPGVLLDDDGLSMQPSSSISHCPHSAAHLSVGEEMLQRDVLHSQSVRYPKRNRSMSKKKDKDKKTMRQKTEGGDLYGGSIDHSVEMEELGGSRMRRTSSMPSVSEPKSSSASCAPTLRPYDYDSKLNKMQKKALRFTWNRLQTRNGGKRVENVFEEVYDRLVRQLPAIREMFNTRTFLSAMSRCEIASLRDHAKVTVKVFDLIIKNLELEKSKRTDTGSALDPKLIGRAHGPLRPYGLTGNYWEKLGETIIDVVLAQEAVRDLPGAGQAWVVLTACLVDQMRAGFDEARHSTFDKSGNKINNNNTRQVRSVDVPSSDGDQSSTEAPPGSSLGTCPVGSPPSIESIDRLSSPSSRQPSKDGDVPAPSPQPSSASPKGSSENNPPSPSPSPSRDSPPSVVDV